MTEHLVGLSMLGVPLAVVTDDERMAEFVRTFWEPFLADAGPDPVEVSVRFAGDRWRLRCASAPGGDAVDPWVLGAILRNLLTTRAVAGSPDIVPLHASVAERDGAYLVLSGPSEAGKTTLMLALLERGWRYVSDDMAPVEGGAAVARPLRKPLSIRDPRRWAATTSRWDVPEWLPPPVNASLVPPSIFAPAPDEPYTPTALVFSSYAEGAEPTFDRLSAGEALALAGQNLQFRTASPADVARLAAWAATPPAARIRYGSTDDALALVDRALGG